MDPGLRARGIGLACGTLPAGARNSIADVPGVRVGHRTLVHDDIRTGVTALVPHGDNLFREKPVAAVHVLNGFGKSAGLMQVEELGVIEAHPSHQHALGRDLLHGPHSSRDREQSGYWP